MSATTPEAAPAPLLDAADRLLTAREVAELLAVPESWVREHTRSGRLPHLPLGRYRRYRRDSVLRWLEEQEEAGAAWRTYRPRHPSQTDTG